VTRLAVAPSAGRNATGLRLARETADVMTVPTETAPADPSVPTAHAESVGLAFAVALTNFEGPFDLLLTLIGRHKLDVTEIALAKVTDDFVAYLRRDGGELDLDTTSQFVVVAATLLDLKAARLLPTGDVEDEEDIALLEARDLLFARLLQYRAYKEVAALLADRMALQARRYPRTVGPDERFVGLLPEVLLGLGPHEFARLAGRALAPRPAPPTVGLAHLHVAQVSVREQATVIATRLQRLGHATFRALVADCDTTVLVIGRFLAVLELFREGVLMFDQVSPLGELHIRWIGPAATDDDIEGNADLGFDPDRFDVDDAEVIDIHRGSRQGEPTTVSQP
jgi:segregation and condensation protein A